MNGLVGRKIGMTRIFNDEGISIPITVIKIEPNLITQVKNLEKDGYNAVQVTTGYKKNKKISRSVIGHFSKSNIRVGCGLWEFRVENSKKFEVGQVFTIHLFSETKKIDVTGISKGKGFSGTIKKWNFSMQDATHGNSLSHRAPGSIGQNQTPGRVFKGKKMASRLGSSQITIQGLSIIKIDLENLLLLVKGAVPGVSGSNVIIKKSIKYNQYDGGATRL